MTNPADPEKMSEEVRQIVTTHEQPTTRYSTKKRHLLSKRQEEDILRHYQALGWLVTKLDNQQPITQRDYEQRANELKNTELEVTARTLRNYVSKLTRAGRLGFCRKTRSDAGNYHLIGEDVIKLTKAIRYSQPDATVSYVLDEVKKRIEILRLAEPEKWRQPSEWQVRQIIKLLPKPEKSLADGRVEEYVSKYEITHPGVYDEIVYELDWTLADVLVRDLRTGKTRSKSGEVRPYLLTIVVRGNSRRILFAGLYYERPDRYIVGVALRKVLLEFGKPDTIRVDGGKEFNAAYLKQLILGMGFSVVKCRPRRPKGKPFVERFNGIVTTQLFSKLPGYVNSNVVERNPNAKATLTVTELQSKLNEYIEQYNNKPKKVLEGLTPCQYWAKYTHPKPVTETRQLDELLMEPVTGKVTKKGVRFGNRFYWHAELGRFVGQKVIIRVGVVYSSSEQVEVYEYSADRISGNWICTATATDSAIGRQRTAQEVLSAQQQQRDYYQSNIKRLRSEQRKIEDKIKKLEQSLQTPTVETGVGDKLLSKSEESHSPSSNTSSDQLNQPAQLAEESTLVPTTPQTKKRTTNHPKNSPVARRGNAVAGLQDEAGGPTLQPEETRGPAHLVGPSVTQITQGSKDKSQISNIFDIDS